MYIFLLVVHVIVSLFLIFIVLIQSAKGEGLSDVFGGGSSQTTIFGTRTGTFLTKATTGSAIVFMITCLSLAFISRKEGGSVVQKELVKEQVGKKVEQIMKEKGILGEEEGAPTASNREQADAQEQEVLPKE